MILKCYSEKDFEQYAKVDWHLNFYRWDSDTGSWDICDSMASPRYKHIYNALLGVPLLLINYISVFYFNHNIFDYGGYSAKIIREKTFKKEIMIGELLK